MTLVDEPNRGRQTYEWRVTVDGAAKNPQSVIAESAESAVGALLSRGKRFRRRGGRGKPPGMLVSVIRADWSEPVRWVMCHNGHWHRLPWRREADRCFSLSGRDCLRGLPVGGELVAAGRLLDGRTWDEIPEVTSG